MACNNPVWNTALWHNIWIKLGLDNNKIRYVGKPSENYFRLAEIPERKLD